MVVVNLVGGLVARASGERAWLLLQVLDLSSDRELWRGHDAARVVGERLHRRWGHRRPGELRQAPDAFGAYFHAVRTQFPDLQAGAWA